MRIEDSFRGRTRTSDQPNADCHARGEDEANVSCQLARRWLATSVTRSDRPGVSVAKVTADCSFAVLEEDMRHHVFRCHRMV